MPADGPGAQPNLRHDGPDPVEITVTVTGAAGRVLLKAATTVTPHHSRTGCPADRTYHGQAMVAADGELRSK
ncbi:hypothetical protein ACIBBE_18250 [Streptomyces sp. NPDC051644]|uniref:hypothetical protein n=1 Tax=Streptomyces sp. NPDC051644 TaxID=3365666 RepID=UPI0037BD5C66